MITKQSDSKITEVIDRRSFLKWMAATGIVSTGIINQSCSCSSDAKGKIVIIGGGAAGLNMAARLTGWLKKADITLIDPSEKQFYQPGFTLVASGVYKPEEVWKKQENCIPKNIHWIKDKVVELDPVSNRITTAENGDVNYDFLVLTPGLQINWDWIEGFKYEDLGKGDAHCIYDFDGAQKTWQAIQQFVEKGGKGVFTDTYTKHKCGGAPKKICLLTEHHSRKQKAREKIHLDFYTAAGQLYDVPHYTPRLLEIYEERNIPIHISSKVTGIDLTEKVVYMEQTSKEDVKTIIKKEYDFLHFTPPMSAPDFTRQTDLGWKDGKPTAEGWISVDKETMVHTKYPNIISLGDCSNLPTSKTSAAIRVQVPIAAKNLISLLEGKNPSEKYNGYAACPIVTEYGHVLLCEFDYEKKAAASFPFNMMDNSKELQLAWLLKVYMLKPLYFYGMIKGRA